MSSSSEEYEGILLHISLFPRQAQVVQHETEAFMHEHPNKHFDFLHLHETGLLIFGFAGFDIKMGVSFLFCNLHPKLVGLGSESCGKCALLYTAIWYKDRSAWK